MRQVIVSTVPTTGLLENPKVTRAVIAPTVPPPVPLKNPKETQNTHALAIGATNYTRLALLASCVSVFLRRFLDIFWCFLNFFVVLFPVYFLLGIYTTSNKTVRKKTVKRSGCTYMTAWPGVCSTLVIHHKYPLLPR